MTKEMQQARATEAVATAARCCKCNRTEKEVNLVWCDHFHCGNYICGTCATPTQWQLEVCSEECGAAVAARLYKTIYALRADVRAIELRRAA